MNKWLNSLLAKYMLIIIMAILVVQLAYLVVGTIALLGFDMGNQEQNSTNIVEEKWHEDAKKLDNVSYETITDLFEKWKKEYPDAGLFWVNGRGELVVEVDASDSLPTNWNAVDTASFIKDRYDGNPYTVIAFVGNNQEDGFIVIEIPRTVFDPPLLKATEKYGYLLLVGVFIIVILFILISFLFFRSIQKRLTKLQLAMGNRDENGLPVIVDIKKIDEIGQLENSFNQMVQELKESKKREQKEEQIRRELIANLSHDLRTPLTKLRAQSYTIKQEALSEEGIHAVNSMESSIDNIDRLIENLMSYTLLMASKYKYEPKEVEISRFVREFFASWYPVFEKEGFHIDVEINPIGTWNIDTIWMGRILDNLFQNIIRHAKSGNYIGIKTESTNTYDAISINDHGKGFEDEASEKGAGIGLTIVDMMVKGMSLDWKIDSTNHGTTIRIIHYR